MRESAFAVPYRPRVCLDLRLFVAIVAGCLLVSGSSSAQQAQAPESGRRLLTTPSISSAEAPIGPGDVLDVQVFDTPELSATKLRVGESGEVDEPVLGPVKVAGLTPAEAGNLIAAKMHDSQIMLDPHVTVVVTEYATEGVRGLGEVRNPGTYLLLGSHSLYAAISAAGGVTHDQGSTITVTHANDPVHPQVVSVSDFGYSESERTTAVKPGDVVVVSRADVIYVIGDVAHPGEYPLQSGRHLTVLNAVALAQGLNPTAASSKASIIRPTTDGKAVTIKLDINRIEQNKELNAVLQPSDVLVIPRSGMREFLTYALPNATGAVTGSVAAALVVR